MMRPSVQGVDPPVCCVLDVTVTYARDSFVDCQAGPFVLSRGGPGILDVTVTYARDSFVDSQAGPFVLSRGGGGAQISWHQSYSNQKVIKCNQLHYFNKVTITF